MSLKLATDNKCPRGIPNSLAMGPEFCYSGVLANNITFVNPASGPGPYQGNQSQKIVLNIPQEMIDFRNSCLEFNAVGNVGNTAGLQCAFVQDIRSIFSRMTISLGSKIIYDTIGYNRLQSVFNYLNEPQWFDYDGAVLCGTDTSVVTRRANFTSTTKKYSVMLGFTKDIESLFRKILPLQKVGSQMQVTLYLEDAAKCISTSAAVTGTIAPSYYIDNIEFHYMTIIPDENLNNRIDSEIKSGALTFTSRGFDEYLASGVALAGASKFSATLPYKYADLLGVIVAFVPAAIEDTWTDDNKMKYFYNPGVNVLRLKIGGQFYPADSTTVDSDVYFRYLIMFGEDPEDVHTAALNWNYNGAAPASASYIPCCPIAKYPNEINADGREVVMGLDTSIATAIQLDIGFSTPLPATMNVYCWAYYNFTVTFNANGSVTLNR